MTDNGSNASRGLAISGAFIGQIGIFAGIGALLVGAASGPVGMSVSAASVPAVAAPAPVIYSAVSQLPDSFSYTFSMDGSASGGTVSGVYPESQSALPAYTVKPGQPLRVKLGATIPDGAKITGLTLTFEQVGAWSTTFSPRELYQDAKRPLGPGQHTFVADWASSKLRPGTQWLVYLTADSAGASEDSPVATVTVTS
jgi:hypothetical protein